MTGATALTIASDAVTYDKMQDLVTANRVLGGTAAGTIAEVQIVNAMMASDSVDSDQYVDGSIDTAHIANDAVTGAKLANSITIAQDLTVSGNLTVSGTTTTVNTTELKVSDNVITLNSDVTGTPGQNAGIEVERGTSANPSLIWAENTDRFMMDYNGSKGNLAIVREESSAPSSSDGMVNGKGGFWLDTANTQMYVMLAG